MYVRVQMWPKARFISFFMYISNKLSDIYILKTTTCNCMLNLTKQRKLFDHMGPCGPMEKASDFKSENVEFESPHGLSAVFFGVVC